MEEIKDFGSRGSFFFTIKKSSSLRGTQKLYWKDFEGFI